MISTRGRYSLRIMLDLAERPQGGYTPMKEVAARQEISLKYIEKIVPLLTKAGFIEGVHGKGGGYRLCRAPEDITAGEVLRDGRRACAGVVPRMRREAVQPCCILQNIADVEGILPAHERVF